MLVLVAGATGVLGRALVPALRDAGHEVRGLARHVPPGAPYLVPADLLSADLAPIVAGCQAVIHAATAIPADRADRDAWAQNTRIRTDGTRRLLAAAQAAGVERYIQQSIVMAYQDGGERWLDESTPFDQSPTRGGVIQSMEALVHASELHWTIVRGGLFPSVPSTRIPCDGQHWLSPIHPADLADAIVACLEHAPPRSTFNITADPIRYVDYVRGFGLTALTFAPTTPCPASHRCTSAHARAILPWQPTRSIYASPH